MNTMMNDATVRTQPRRVQKSRRTHADEIDGAFRRGYWFGLRQALAVNGSPLEPQYARVLAMPEGDRAHV